jgi:hypothetical protein
VAQLLAKHREVLGKPSSSRHKRHLIRRIAWGLQAQVQGHLSERALRRAAQLVDNSDLRVAATCADRKKQAKTARRRLPLPGTILVRRYKGRELEVTVLDHGFEYEGRVFATLSAVAKAITGSHWNGYQFFRLTRQRKGNV